MTSQRDSDRLAQYVEAEERVLADFARTRRRGWPDQVWYWDGLELPDEQAELIAQIAGLFQEHHSQEIFCWPECLTHDSGMDPIVRADTAVWWCKRGDHVVARIGELGISSAEQ